MSLKGIIKNEKKEFVRMPTAIIAKTEKRNTIEKIIVCIKP